MRLLFQSDSADPELWREALLKELPGLDFRIWPDGGDPDAVDILFMWRLPQEIGRFRNLKLVQLISAGTDQLGSAGGLPAHVPIARMIEPGQVRGMSEYVLASVLHYHRDFHLYRRQQAARQWREYPRRPAQRRSVGVMGLGALGAPVAEMLAAHGFDVHGWTRRRRAVAGVTIHSGREALPGFLRAAEIVVAMLPLTPDTVGLFDRAFFAAMRPGSFFVNVGRGAQCDQPALIAALRSGHLAGATLDVLVEEPPAEHDPVWMAPNLTLTPHVATSPDIATAAKVVADNIRRALTGLPPHNAVERADISGVSLDLRK